MVMRGWQGWIFRRLAAWLLGCAGLLGAGAWAGLPNQPVNDAPRAALQVVSDENYPPYLFRDADGHVAGYLVDYWRLWEKKTGVKVELTATNWAQAQRLILHGQADVIDMIYRTAPREPLYDFSAPYADLPVAIFSHVDIGGITGVATLKGLQVGVQAGDACIDQLAEKGITTVVEYPNYAALIGAAQRQEVKVFCLDEPPANFYLYKFKAESEFKKAFELYVGQFHRAVRKGEGATLRLVERGVQAITPEEDAELRKKWFGAPVGGRLNSAYVVRGLLLLGALGLLLLLWNLSLRRRVAARTTELVRAREATLLAERDQRYRTLFEAAPVALTHVRGDAITSVNRRFVELFGYAQDEIPTLEQWWARAYPDPLYRQVVQQTWAAALERAAQTDGRIENLEYQVTRKNGEAMTLLIGGQLVDDGLIATFKDISVLKQAQAAQKEALAAAEAASQAKANFLANMSHEIRTPMNAVIGLTFLALRADPTPRQRDYLLKIQQSSRHLLGVINDILDYSKIEAGKLAVEQIGFDLETVLDTVVFQVAERAAAKGLELIADMDPAVPPHLLGDPLRIGQVLINYANNAVKFTEHGEVVIQASLQARDGDRVLLRFAVRDTGIGIDDAHRQRLFQSFQQTDSSITRRYGGTGLGLAISKRLVELMGGEVGFDSTPGGGSTFWFTVRLPVAAPPSTGRLQPDWQGRHVLLVDDNAQARQVVGELLRGMRLTVTAVPSGAAALAELTRAAQAGASHDLVLLDWKMPELDGIETAREIARLPLAPPPIVLMSSAYERDALVPVARAAGVGEVLAKPVNPSALLNVLLPVFGAAGAPLYRAIPPGQRLPLDLSRIAGARVLLVEDNELNQEVALELLRRAGVDVELAADGAIALQKVRDSAYDLILMDMQMPVLDGLSATREMRKLEHVRAVPIVAMTANAMAGDRERCLEAGMNDHLAKPIDPDLLDAMLLQWIATGPAHASAAAPQDVPSSAPDAGVLQLLHGIAGLDAAQGLRLALGRDALYLSLLGKFMRAQSDVAARLAQAITGADRDAAQQLAHTLKGNAAQIGAADILALAQQLEQALRAGAPLATLQLLQTRLADELAPLLAALNSRLSARA